MSLLLPLVLGLSIPLGGSPSWIISISCCRKVLLPLLLIGRFCDISVAFGNGLILVLLLLYTSGTYSSHCLTNSNNSDNEIVTFRILRLKKMRICVFVRYYLNTLMRLFYFAKNRLVNCNDLVILEKSFECFFMKYWNVIQL